jgi:hypothetical protein
MNADELRQLIRNSTTRPFKVYADGKEFLIADPDVARVSGPWTGSGQSLFIAHKEDARVDVLDLSNISRVEFQPAPS